MRVKARAVFDPNTFSRLGIPTGRGYLLLEIGDDYRAKMGEEVKKIVKRQADKHAEAVSKWESVPPEQRGPEPVYRDFLLDLELDLEIHYRKRTVDQNALMWALYDIEANYLNGTPTYANGYWSNRLPGHIITPMQIHDDDVEVYCERQRYQIWRKDKFAFTRAMELGEMGRVQNVRGIEGQTDKIAVDVVKTTSFMTTVEMSQWTKRIMERIVDNGLLRTDESRFIGIRQDLEDIIKGKRKEKTKL